MAVTVDNTKGAYTIPALSGSGYVPIGGGTMTGALTLPGGTAGAPSLSFTTGGADTGFYAAAAGEFHAVVSGASKLWFTGGGVYATGAVLGLYQNSSYLTFGTSLDIKVYRDAAGSLAQRNGTAQQSFSVYNSYTDPSNYERLKLTGVAGTSVNITAETLGTGGDNLDIVITPAGSGFVNFPGGFIKVPLNATFRNTDSTGNGLFYMDVSNLVLRRGDAASSFGAIFFGGTSSSEPGIKKNGAALDLRLADDSAYTDLKLRNLLNTEYHQMTEMTAPSAPATNSVRIYAEDNGSGKTRLMALFATGAAQQLAIEP